MVALGRQKIPVSRSVRAAVRLSDVLAEAQPPSLALAALALVSQGTLRERRRVVGSHQGGNP